MYIKKHRKKEAEQEIKRNKQKEHEETKIELAENQEAKKQSNQREKSAGLQN